MKLVKLSKMNISREFTIIELLVAISIICIVTNMLMPSLAKVRDNSKAAVCKSNLRQINIALIAYSDGENETCTLKANHRWIGVTPTFWDDRLFEYYGKESLTINQQLQNGLQRNRFSENYDVVQNCESNIILKSFESNTDCMSLSYAVNYYYNNVRKYE